MTWSHELQAARRVGFPNHVELDEIENNSSFEL